MRDSEKHTSLLLYGINYSCNGSCTLAKFVGEDDGNIVKQYRLLYLPWPSNTNRNNPICAGSTKANRRQPKTGLGRVFNFKFVCFDDARVLIYVDAHPHL
jgi:hypothetical protein